MTAAGKRRVRRRRRRRRAAAGFPPARHAAPPRRRTEGGGGGGRRFSQALQRTLHFLRRAVRVDPGTVASMVDPPPATSDTESADPDTATTRPAPLSPASGAVPNEEEEAALRGPSPSSDVSSDRRTLVVEVEGLAQECAHEDVGCDLVEEMGSIAVLPSTTPSAPASPAPHACELLNASATGAHVVAHSPEVATETRAPRRVLFSPAIAAYRPFFHTDPVFASDPRHRYAKMVLCNFAVRAADSVAALPPSQAQQWRPVREWTGSEEPRHTPSRHPSVDGTSDDEEDRLLNERLSSHSLRPYDSDRPLSSSSASHTHHFLGRSRLVSDTAPPPAAFLFQQASVRKVVLETLHVHDYPLLRGTVLVANLAFEKRVLVRLTYDSWLSYVDVPCEFAEAVSDSELTCSPVPGSLGNPTSLRLDRFTFSYLIPPCVL